MVRILDAESREGEVLLRTGQVMWIGPRGEALGRVNLGQARRLLQSRLESLLVELGPQDGAEAVRDGLLRLRRTTPRIGRA